MSPTVQMSNIEIYIHIVKMLAQMESNCYYDYGFVNIYRY